MRLVAFKSKIHRATVTEADLNYEGSITLDADLMDAAEILPHEQVQILNVNNGERFDTYAIRGARGSGVVCLNGPAARLAPVALGAIDTLVDDLRGDGVDRPVDGDDVDHRLVVGGSRRSEEAERCG